MSDTPVLDLLSDPKHWTKGAYARDKECSAIAAWRAEAVCWCLYGALLKSYSIVHTAEYEKVVARIEAAIPEAVCDAADRAIVYFNDHPDTTYEMVLDVVRKAQA